MRNRKGTLTWCRGLLLCAGVVAAGAAGAQAQQRPEWVAGDTWTFHQTGGLPAKESEWSRKVVEALPDRRFKVVTESNSNLTFDSEGNSIDQRGPDFSWRRLSFPLEVGKAWKHERKIAGDTWTGTESSSWEVKAAEKITVPGGTFDCVRVEGSAFRNWSSPGGGQGYNQARTETTYWYCPAVKWAAKWIVRDQARSAAPVVTTESVLTSFVAGK